MQKLMLRTIWRIGLFLSFTWMLVAAFSMRLTPLGVGGTFLSASSGGEGSQAGALQLVSGSIHGRCGINEVSTMSPLFEALEIALIEEQTAWLEYDYGSFRGDYLISPNARAVFGYIQAILESFILSDCAPAQSEETGFPIEWVDRLADLPVTAFPPRPVWTLWSQVLAQSVPLAALPGLKGNSNLIIKGFDLVVLDVELDGDPGEERLVQASSVRANLFGWLPMNEQTPGQYQWIPNELAHANQVFAPSMSVYWLPAGSFVSSAALGEAAQRPALLVSRDEQDMGSTAIQVWVYVMNESGWLIERETVTLGAGESARRMVLPEGARLIFGPGISGWELASGDKLRIASVYNLNFGCVWEEIHDWPVPWPNEPRVPTQIAGEDDHLPTACALAAALFPSKSTLFQDADLASRVEILQAAKTSLVGEAAAGMWVLSGIHLALAEYVRADILSGQASAQTQFAAAVAALVEAGNRSQPTLFSAMVETALVESIRPPYAAGLPMDFCAHLATPENLASLGLAQAAPDVAFAAYFSASAQLDMLRMLQAYGHAVHGQPLLELLCPTQALARSLGLDTLRLDEKINAEFNAFVYGWVVESTLSPDPPLLPFPQHSPLNAVARIEILTVHRRAGTLLNLAVQPELAAFLTPPPPPFPDPTERPNAGGERAFDRFLARLDAAAKEEGFWGGAVPSARLARLALVELQKQGFLPTVSPYAYEVTAHLRFIAAGTIGLVALGQDFPDSAWTKLAQAQLASRTNP